MKIKVSPYRISIRTQSRGGVESENLKFGEPQTKDGSTFSIVPFLTAFVQSFDGKFKGVRREDNRAMRLTQKLTFSAPRNQVSGFFRGGKTKVRTNIYDGNAKSSDVEFEVEDHHVNAAESYFVVWIDPNEYQGILVVQGTSVDSSADLFKSLLHVFLRQYFPGLVVKVERFHGAAEIEEFRENSSVKKIRLTKVRYPRDRVDNLLGEEISESDMTIQIVIKGNFNDSKVMRKLTETTGISFGQQPKFFTSDLLESLDFGEDDTYETDVELKDERTKKAATAKSKSGFQINPFTYLSDAELGVNPNNQVPTREAIKLAVDRYFQRIQQEIQ